MPQVFPNQLTRNNSGTGTSAGGDDSQTGLFNGWLLPHFELGDANPVGTSGGDHWERGYLTSVDRRWDRTGEDVIANNVLAFDIKGFDRNAPTFLTTGPDGQPGQIGVDDDGNGTTDLSAKIGFQAISELGAIGSDDVAVGVGDIGIRNVMGRLILDPRVPVPTTTTTPTPHDLAFSTTGAFVDLMYPYLAGSPLLNRTSEAIAGTGIVDNNYDSFFQTELSLYPIPFGTGTGRLNSIKRSGKLVHADTGGNIWYSQPTYDTWTDQYEFDGFDQMHTELGAVSGAPELGTRWVLNNSTGLINSPRLTSPTRPELQVDTGRLAPTEPETSAPFAFELPAFSMTVRLVDPATDEMTQFTVVEELQ